MVDPRLIVLGLQAIETISNAVQLYAKGELPEEEYKKLVQDMHARADRVHKIWGVE